MIASCNKNKEIKLQSIESGIQLKQVHGNTSFVNSFNFFLSFFFLSKN